MPEKLTENLVWQGGEKMNENPQPGRKEMDSKE